MIRVTLSKIRAALSKIRVALSNKIRRPLARAQQYRLFRSEFQLFKAASNPKRFPVEWRDRFPFLDDRTKITGFDRHYVYHTAWAARILAESRPASHVDIGSYLYFSTIVSAFVPVYFYDYRPAQVALPGLQTGFADLLALPFENGSVVSLSCMHVVEHVGLGRYGDPIDPDGDLKAMAELARVLAPGGNLLFVVPVGQPKVMFNGQRIYSYVQVIDAFPKLVLEKFTLIAQLGPDGLVSGASPERVAAESYGCGCFWFRRPQTETENI